MDAEERALLRSTIETALATVAPRAGGSDPGIPADEVLRGLGWEDMLTAEPRDAVDLVFAALGTTNAAASALDDVLGTALGATPAADRAVVLPAFGTWGPPGRIEAGRLIATGLATGRATSAARLGVVASAGPDLVIGTVERAAADVTPVHGVDPDAGWCTVRIETTEHDAAPLDPTAWAAAIASGRRALARQMEGAARTMLHLARDHARERVQFGRPVGAFQAVRHRLADALVAIEALAASIDAAWDEPGPETAALAKALAGRSSRTVAAHCQQVLAGIGFTTDHPFHHFLKRVLFLDGVLGTTEAITVDLGHTLLASGVVPTLIELSEPSPERIGSR